MDFSFVYIFRSGYNITFYKNIRNARITGTPGDDVFENVTIYIYKDFQIFKHEKINNNIFREHW